MALFAMVGCTPSTYEGSGSIGSADFTYAGDNCQGYVRGHFNWNDNAAGVVFHAELSSFTQECVSCDYCADGEDEMLFSYSNQGSSGDGVGCYLENVGTITILSGVHAGYVKSGPIENVQGGVGVPCD